MDMEEFKEKYEELKNNPMYQKYCSVLEIKDKVIKKSQQENQQLKELVNGIGEGRDYLFNKLTLENQQLKEENEYLIASDLEKVKMIKQLEDRIDKAIKILKGDDNA